MLLMKKPKKRYLNYYNELLNKAKEFKMILLKKHSQEIAMIDPNEIACVDTTHRINDYTITIIFKSSAKRSFEFYAKETFNEAMMNLTKALRGE